MNMTLNRISLSIATAVCALILNACHQESAPAAVATPPASDSHMAAHPSTAQTPAATNGPVAKISPDTGCEATLTANDAMQFNLKELVVDDQCQQLTLHVKHIGNMPKTAMGHNVVITTDAQLKGVLSDALKAGKEHDYLQPNDARVLAHSKLLGAGEQDTIVVDVARLKGQEHVFVCTFPGHSAPMRGRIRVEA